MKIEMIQNRNKSGSRNLLRSDRIILTAVLIFSAAAAAFAQETAPAQVPDTIKLTSAEFVGADGQTIEKLVELGNNRRADLLAARQNLAIAEGRLKQARQRINPTLEAEYGSSRFLGGEAESDFSVGVSQTFELGGKRSKRIAVAQLEIGQIRAEIAALERRSASEIRTAYVNALAAARQLDVLEKLIAANLEIVRVTKARLNEGDAAPLEENLVKVEADRLKIQAIQARSELETEVLELKTLTGADLGENLRLAPQAERPPRLDIGLSELTTLALEKRADLKAAKLGEELGNARINLARANAAPNIAGSVQYSRSRGIIDLPEQIGGGLATDLDKELTFGVSIDIPFFNRNQGEIAAATGERIQAAREREFLEASIRRDVAVAYRKYRAAAETLVIYSAQILPLAEANLQSVRAAYGFGEFSVFEVVNEQRRLTENITDYNRSLRDYYAALAQLETALGASLPPDGFAPGSSSVLPDKDLIPAQSEREKFLQTPEKIDLAKKSRKENKEENK